MRTTIMIRSLLICFVVLSIAQGAFAVSPARPAQIGVGISVSFGPPPLPIYEQPLCPSPDWIWTPGYWAYDEDDGYYWVPGTWVEAPQVGFLWTPGYWGWGGSAFIFHEGFWGPQMGFYGGINYGFGYFGNGYEGGRWEGGHFAYNTYVNRVDTTIIRNTYNVRVTNVTETHVSYNGGEGGIPARPSAEQEAYQRQPHVPPVAAQTQHVQAARGNPELRATANHGKPPIAATAKPGDFKTAAQPAKQAGGEYKAPPANSARGNAAPAGSASRPATENRPENGNAAHPNTTPNHASELQPHTFTPPNSGNAANDKKYQQQQDKLAAQQAKDHQKLQQQQEKEHQQATQKNYNDTQKQQMEQKHTQQTQQLEQKHTAQQQHIQQHQAPPPSHAPAEKPH